MARQARLEIPGFPLHVVQRGNDRQRCFADAADHARYRHRLHDSVLRTGCSLHAYVLMGNHVHLLLTPAETGAASRLMQMLGRSYVAYFNLRHGRTGTLWEGRFKSSLVDSDDYLLACQRYIENNPVRGGLAPAPEAHAWSSYRHYAFGEPDGLLTPHAAYFELGSTPDSRQSAYRAMFRLDPEEQQLNAIRDHLSQQRVWGRPEFQTRVAKLLNRPVALRRRGRQPRVDSK